MQLNLLPPSIKGTVLAVVSFGDVAGMNKLAQLIFAMTDGQQTLAEDYLSIEKGVEGNLLVMIVRDGEGWTIKPFAIPVQRTSNALELSEAARTALARQH